MVRICLLLFLNSLALVAFCQSPESQVLWYDEPANDWNSALPIGNGRLGAMVFGNPAQERLQLNEETVWAGEPGNNLPEGFNEVLPEVRKLLFEEKYVEAEELLMTKVPRHAGEGNNYGMPYQPVGDLLIDFPSHKNVKNYKRDLDISNAIASVSYQVDGVTYKREFFSSFKDDVIIVKLSASKPGSITCQLSLTTPHAANEITAKNDQLVLSGTTSDQDNKLGKVKFNCLAQPKIKGGKLSITNNAIHIEKADEAIIYLSMATNFVSYSDLTGNAYQKAEEFLLKATNQEYDDVKKAHISHYKNYFDRVEFNLLGDKTNAELPTDERLKNFSKSQDLSFVSLYFQFGRYLLISSSQPNTQPANLQGIWNDKLSPSWDSKYTVNINTEMNYWPAEVTNLSELHQPLFSMIEDLSVVGKQSAKEMYSARGWVMHHNTDIWRMTGPIDGAFYGMWPMGGAWLTQHIWQHYLFSGDEDFVAKYFPILEECAKFYVDVLQEEPTHQWQVITPSMSPENRHPGGTSLAPGNTMDNQLVFDVFSNYLQAAQILGKTSAFGDTVLNKLQSLPPMQIGRLGQLQEWMKDWDSEGDKHRHVSHLYGLYPSNQISPFTNPALFSAAKTSLVFRGDVSTGWSMGWKVNLWARLLDGNRAYKLIADQLTPAQINEDDKNSGGGTYPNLLDAHPPFQIDGNFGCTSGIAEMLVQSHDGNIFILPALPDQWKTGNISGLVTRGGFIIDLEWENGQLKKLVVTSKLGGNCRIRSASTLELQGGELAEAKGTNPNPFYQQAQIEKPLAKDIDKVEEIEVPDTFLYDFVTKKGERYILTIK